jgi:hypothetical protein
VVVTVGVIVVGSSTGSPTAMDLVRCEWAVVVGTVGTPTDAAAAVSSMLLWIEVVMGSPIAMRFVRLAWIGREQSPPPPIGAALSRQRPEDGWVELADAAAAATCWVERNDNDDEVVPLPPPLIVVAPPALPPDKVYIV